MKPRFPSLLTFIISLFLATPLQQVTAAEPTSVDEFVAIAKEAYIYGYPLVTMEMTRRVMTNVSNPVGTRAPMGQFVRMRSYPDAQFKDVTAPNADTLYTTAWINVGKEPWILSLPEMHDRYFLFPMLDAWTNVFQVPGKRTTGTTAQKYAITGPGWTGSLPKDVKQYQSPTDMVWLLGRIYCTGTPEDYAAVHKLQDEISLVPLSAYGKAYAVPVGQVDPSIDMKMPVRDQVNSLSCEAYFNLLAALMEHNPPAADDAPMLAKMAKIGIVPGKKFELKNASAEIQKAVADIPKASFEEIMAHFKAAGRAENGWIFTTDAGVYGTLYLQRALIAAIGLGANRPQDAIYPTSEVDSQGQLYDGKNRYVIHVEKGELPPVDGFWSLTMYDGDYFFVSNPLNRYFISARNHLTSNPDGSIDLYLQHESPGPEKESNWLPSPSSKFILMLRLYWPKEIPPSIIDGTWKIPAVNLN